MKIGFIGVGIMGKSMVRNLMKNGHEVQIFTRTKEKVLDVIEEGAVWKNSVKECCVGAQAIMTIVGYPSDVKEVYFGENGIIENAANGAYIIDLTTSSPDLAKEIYDHATAKQLKAMDAPVTGGDVGAKNGTLAILVGGDQQAFDEFLPIYKAIGQNISYCGKAGSGQHTKMCNQIVIAGTISGLCEALSYAKAHEIDWQMLLKAISTGAAGSNQMNAVVPKLINDDFDPGFFIKHFIKDLKIAQSGSEGLGLDVLNTTLKNYSELEQKGFGDLGTQGLIMHYINLHLR